MVRVLQIIATIIVFGVAPIVWIDGYSNSGFIDNFMETQSLSVMGTILAIYIAAAASFLAIVMGHEKARGKVIFNGTSTELKHNIIFVIAIFVAHFFLMAATPPLTETNQILLLSLRSSKVFTFLLYIYALYEMSNVLFGIRDTLNKQEDGQ